jgi:hypothetical protein
MALQAADLTNTFSETHKYDFQGGGGGDEV